MRRTGWLLLLTLLLPFALRATELLLFEGEVVDSDAVQLSWSVDSAAGLAGFVVERSTDDAVYRQIGDRLPIDGLDYALVDRPGLAGAGEGGDEVDRGGARTDTEQRYFYRLWYVLPSGERLLASEQPIEVSFQLSTVSLTWGGIKAMFR